DVSYFKDVVDNIKTLSGVFGYGAAILITGLSVVTFALIMVTIRFNLLAHKNEIEIMHLVGSSDSYIKIPFLLQGAVYGSIGAIISTLLILAPWYIIIYSFRDSDFFFWLSQFLSDLSFNFLLSFNLLFVLLFVGLVLLIGVLFGV